ncbi:hypothetical protein [Nocardia brasiliensis]|uniref:hypothetical protein n=1 Tax=Nocardia brasiliensis TaxID=37326 RepID=UPI000E0824DB|nr:hypothetical protein [Nocardia brasiliensis]SUB48022.1 Uncharacterised protein [Nocardia brasiliensis]
MQNELVVELVRSVRANHRSDRPFTWQACSANGETLSVKAFPAEDHVLPTGSDAFTLPSLIGRLDTMLRAPGDHRPLVLEVALDGPAAQFRHSFELSSLTPCSVLIDPEFRYPNHYRGATPRPSAAQPSTLPTDPRVHRHVRSLVDEFTTYYRRVKGRAPQFGPPCPAADLVAAEAALGMTGCPVRVERLAALPALLRLDVSGADVDDVAALADLDLRVLVLDAEQWARLWAADRVPERLAVAECVGDVALPQLAEWAAWLHGKVGNAVKAVAPQGNT